MLGPGGLRLGSSSLFSVFQKNASVSLTPPFLVFETIRIGAARVARLAFDILSTTRRAFTDFAPILVDRKHVAPMGEQVLNPSATNFHIDQHGVVIKRDRQATLVAVTIREVDASDSFIGIHDEFLI